jgi:hypothetical protein
VQRYDIALTPSLYAVGPGNHLQFVLTTQAPSDKCASLLTALTTPLPCLFEHTTKEVGAGRRLPGPVGFVLPVVGQCADTFRQECATNDFVSDADQLGRQRAPQLGRFSG